MALIISISKQTEPTAKLQKRTQASKTHKNTTSQPPTASLHLKNLLTNFFPYAIIKTIQKPLKEGISMRKSLLAMAALMGISTLPAHAWRVNIDKETYADIGFSTQIWGRNEGKRTNLATDHNATNFYMNLANITASGHVNKLVYFSINAESAAFRGSAS